VPYFSSLPAAVTPIGANWTKSSFCGPQPNCVEVRYLNGMVEVRDGKNLSGVVMVLTRGEWEMFVLGAKNEEFELPDE
jgi:hypothetical protein